MNHSLNAPVQLAARVISDLQTARHRLMGMAGSPPSWGPRAGRPANPQSHQAILLSHMLGRANDAIKDDFAHIVDGKAPRYEVLLRDKATGELIDPSTGVALNALPS